MVQQIVVFLRDKDLFSKNTKVKENKTKQVSRRKVVFFVFEVK
jgi:hypothetical protein